MRQSTVLVVDDEKEIADFIELLSLIHISEPTRH